MLHHFTNKRLSMKNFTNNPLLSILILLLITANVVTLTLLWIHNKNDKGRREMPPPPQGPGGQVFEFVTNELKLDSTQQLSYKKLRDEHQAAQKPLQDSIRKSKDDLFSLLSQANAADADIQTASKKTAEFEQQLDLLTFHHFQKLRAICTAGQQKRFDEIIKDVLRRMAPPRRQGPPPGREGEGPGGPEGRRPPPPPEG